MDDILRTNSKIVREKDKIASNSQNRSNSRSSNETLHSYLDIKTLQDEHKGNISGLIIDQIEETTKEKGKFKP